MLSVVYLEESRGRQGKSTQDARVRPEGVRNIYRLVVVELTPEPTKAGTLPERSEPASNEPGRPAVLW